MNKTEWKKVKLGEIAKIGAGQSAPKYDADFGNQGLPFIRAGYLEKLVSNISENSFPKISVDIASKYKLKKYPSESVIFAKSGMSATLNRIYKLKNESYIVSHLAIIEPNHTLCNSDFLKFLLFWENPSNLIKDSAYPSISLSDINDWDIFIPPINHQRHIAATLDKANELIALRKKQLKELDALAEAVFYDMFGDPTKNEKEWKCIKMESGLAVYPQNGLYKPSSCYVEKGGTPILRIDAFYDGKVTDWSSLKRLSCSDKELKSYHLNENDIVINRVNSIEYLGKCALIRGLHEITVFESNMMRFRMNSEILDTRFIVHLLCSKFIYNQIIKHAKKAVNQASINQKDVLDFDILLPPLSLQSHFATIIEKIEEQKAQVRKSLQESEDLFQRLMQDLFKPD